VTFDEECQPLIDKIDLNIKNKKQYTLSIDEAKKFDLSLTKKYYIKLTINSSTQEMKLFREHPQYKRLTKAGVKIVHAPLTVDKVLYSDIQSLGREKTSFQGVFQELLKRKDPQVREVYDEIFGESNEE
jgi:predicted CopG family antitoxin